MMVLPTSRNTMAGDNPFSLQQGLCGDRSQLLTMRSGLLCREQSTSKKREFEGGLLSTERYLSQKALKLVNGWPDEDRISMGSYSMSAEKDRHCTCSPQEAGSYRLLLCPQH